MPTAVDSPSSRRLLRDHLKLPGSTRTLLPPGIFITSTALRINNRMHYGQSGKPSGAGSGREGQDAVPSGNATRMPVPRT